MKSFLKIMAFTMAIIVCSIAADAQKAEKPFFGKTFLVPPAAAKLPARTNGAMAMASMPLSTTVWDTTFFQIKPIAGLAYSFPNYQAQAVTGISYQHIKYKYQTAGTPAIDYCDYSINVLLSLGATTVPNNVKTDLASFGVGMGVLNNKITLCFLLNSYKEKVNTTQQQRLKPVGAIMYSF